MLFFKIQVKLTTQYLELMKYEALAKNTKIYFGESIPKIWGNLSPFLDQTNDKKSLSG